MAPRFQLLPLYFGLGYDSVDFVLDVGRLMKFKMAATETGSRGLHLEFRLIANVGQCRQCHRRVRHGRKCDASRWNRVASSFRSIVISISGFGGRHLDFL